MGPYLGLAWQIWYSRCSKVCPNCMDSLGTHGHVHWFTPWKLRSTINLGLQSHWGTMPKGDNHRLGRSLTRSNGRTVQKPLITKSAISSCMKSTWSLADLCGPQWSLSQSLAGVHKGSYTLTGAPLVCKKSSSFATGWGSFPMSSAKCNLPHLAWTNLDHEEELVKCLTASVTSLPKWFWCSVAAVKLASLVLVTLLVLLIEGTVAISVESLSWLFDVLLVCLRHQGFFEGWGGICSTLAPRCRHPFHRAAPLAVKKSLRWPSSGEVSLWCVETQSQPLMQWQWKW